MDVVKVAVCIAAVTVCLSACRPITSQDTIYGDAAREIDPARTAPYILPEGPGRADSQTRITPPAGSAPDVLDLRPPVQTFQSVDLGSARMLLRVWIDGAAPQEALGSRMLRMTTPVARQPKLKFELTPDLGQFRGAAIQIYRVVHDQPDKDSGVRFQEDGEYTLLTPGREIDLAKCAPLARRIADGVPLSVFELLVDTEYELQFLVSGSKSAYVVGVRVRTAKPAAATQPATRPDDRDIRHLPPGVIIPK